jgi:DNA (cytosine-5)-methyltransferase 1
MCHAIHAGLYREGLDSRLIFANEIRPELLDHAREANDCWESDTVGIAAPMQELAFDRWAMAKLPDVDILEAGIPCSGASLSGRSKRKLGVPEDHPEVGHLAVAFLAIVAAVNPLVVVLENVPQYRDTASGAIIRSQLRDLGYAVHEVVLSGESFNAVEDRKRYCMVAVTNGVSFSMNDLVVPERIPVTLGDALDEVDDDDPRWSAMPGLKAKQERDKEAGKGFMMQVFDGGSTRIGTITKGYAKVRSTDPKIRHPRNPDLLRQLTAGEHARVKQIPERLIDGLCETTAHEVLGQSVIYGPFMAIGALIANALKRWAIEGPSGCQQGDAALIACG